MNQPFPAPYEQQLAAARSNGQQAMLWESQGNPAGAAQGYDQAIGWTIQSMNTAMQCGVFIPDAIHFELGYAHLSAARVKATMGWMPVAQQHLFQAMGSVNQAIAINPHMANYHVLAGVILANQGNLPFAERAFSTALTINPSDGYARFMLANVHAALGNSQAAQGHFAQVQQAYPGIPRMSMSSPPAGPQQGSDWMKTTGDWASLAEKLFKAVGSYQDMAAKFDGS